MNSPRIAFYTDNSSSGLSGKWEALVRAEGLPAEIVSITDPAALKAKIEEKVISLWVFFPEADLSGLPGLDKITSPVILVDHPDLPSGTFPAHLRVRHLSSRDTEDFLFMVALLSRPVADMPDPHGPDYGLLKKIFSSAEELILVTQGDYIVFFNDKIPRFLGRDTEYILSHPFWDFIHPDDHQLVGVMKRKRLEGKLDNVPYKFRLLDPRGKVIWMQNTGYRIDWQGKPATLNFLIFIGEQIEAENRIRNVEAFLQDIFEFSPLGLAILDKEMALVRVNGSLLDKLGMSEEELLRRKIWEIPVFEESGIVEKLFLRESGKKYDGIHAEVTIKCPNKTVRDCLVSRHTSPIEESTILWFTEVTDKNRIMNGLRRSEQKYRNLLENMHEGILAMGDDGKITEYNMSLMRMLGYDKQTLKGKNYWDITPSFWQPLEKKILADLFRDGQVKKYEKEFVCNDGSLLYTEVYALLREESCGKEQCVWMFLRDITQEKLNEQEILERELKYRTILEYSPLPLISENFSALREYLWQLGNLGVGDVKKYLKDHPGVVKEMIRLVKPLEASQKALEFFEVKTVEELEEAYRQQTLSDELVENFSGLLTTFLNGGNVFEGEMISMTKSGQKKNVILRWVLVPGHELSWDMVLVAITDLSERMEYEEQLKVLSSAVNNSPASVVITDPKGIIQYVNPKFTEVTGYTAEEAIGQNPRILKSGNLPDSFYKEMWETITQGKEWRGEFENKKKNGEIFWELASISGIQNEKGEITYYVAIKENISERKKTELELIRAKEKAEESDRLKTAFLANMSHEIRTPLNAIIGFTEMLRNETLNEEMKEEYFAIINQSSQVLLKLIDDIIDVAKIEAGHIRIIPHKTDITALMQELYVIVRRDLSVSGKEVTPRLSLPWDHEFIINVDSFRLKQVLLNLLNNAVKFTESGSIEFGYRVKSRMIEFMVRDTGIGIPGNQHKVIFDRFRQADDSSTRKYGGTGLGLWVSNNLVHLMGGTIRLKSEQGRGATFYVELPLGEDVTIPEDVREPSGEVAAISDWRDKKILVAEDNDSNYEYLKAVLSVKKVILVRAYDGKEVLNLLMEHDDVDLVLMDIQMPVLNGYEATKLVKKFKPDLPVVAQTAYAMSEDRERIIQAGCDEYISKPIQPRKLLALIEKFLFREESPQRDR